MRGVFMPVDRSCRSNAVLADAVSKLNRSCEFGVGCVCGLGAVLPGLLQRAWIVDLSCGSNAVLADAVSELNRGFEFVEGCIGGLDAMLHGLLQRAWIATEGALAGWRWFGCDLPLFWVIDGAVFSVCAA